MKNKTIFKNPSSFCHQNKNVLIVTWQVSKLHTKNKFQIIYSCLYCKYWNLFIKTLIITLVWNQQNIVWGTRRTEAFYRGKNWFSPNEFVLVNLIFCTTQKMWVTKQTSSMFLHKFQCLIYIFLQIYTLHWIISLHKQVHMGKIIHNLQSYNL